MHRWAWSTVAAPKMDRTIDRIWNTICCLPCFHWLHGSPVQPCTYTISCIRFAAEAIHNHTRSALVCAGTTCNLQKHRKWGSNKAEESLIKQRFHEWTLPPFLIAWSEQLNCIPYKTCLESVWFTDLIVSIPYASYSRRVDIQATLFTWELLILWPLYFNVSISWKIISSAPSLQALQSLSLVHLFSMHTQKKKKKKLHSKFVFCTNHTWTPLGKRKILFTVKVSRVVNIPHATG